MESFYLVVIAMVMEFVDSALGMDRWISLRDGVRAMNM